MSFVLELQFDLSSETFVTEVMQQLKDSGLPSNLLEKSVSPHLTFLASETMLDKRTLEKLDKLLESQTALLLSAVSLGTFVNEQGVLFLGVVVNQALLDIHFSVYDCVIQSSPQLNPYYVPERWVPHITLATGLTREQLAQAVERIELTLPVELGVSRLALVRYPAPLELLKTWTFATSN
jgi:2'-5' RNA ligase